MFRIKEHFIIGAERRDGVRREKNRVGERLIRARDYNNSMIISAGLTYKMKQF